MEQLFKSMSLIRDEIISIHFMTVLLYVKCPKTGCEMGL